MGINIMLKLQYGIKVFGKSTLEGMLAPETQELTGT